MKKRGFTYVCLFLIFIFVNALAVFGQDDEDDVMSVPMGIIVLDPPELVEPKRSSVDFPHYRHFGFTCTTCHHKWEKEEPIPSCGISECHDVEISPTKTKESDPDSDTAIRYYKKAFHKQCIGCHQKMRRKNLELEMSKRDIETEIPLVGPTGCIQCHPKEEE